MCFADLLTKLRAAGVSATESQIRWAIKAGHVSQPKRDGSLRFIYDEPMVAELVAHFKPGLQVEAAPAEASAFLYPDSDLRVVVSDLLASHKALATENREMRELLEAIRADCLEDQRDHAMGVFRLIDAFLVAHQEKP